MYVLRQKLECPSVSVKKGIILLLPLLLSWSGSSRCSACFEKPASRWQVVASLFEISATSAEVCD